MSIITYSVNKIRYLFAFIKIYIYEFLIFEKKIKITEFGFIDRCMRIAVIKKILNLNSYRLAYRIYKKNCIFNNIYNKIFVKYVLYFKYYMPKIIKITSKVQETFVEKEKGKLFISYHFKNDLLGLIYYFGKNYDEIYIVHNNDFLYTTLKPLLNIQNLDKVNDLDYLKKWNHNFKIRFIDSTDSRVIFKIIELLKKGKNVLLYYDLFFNNQQLKQNKGIKYYRQDEYAAIVPKSLFLILEKSNPLLFTIVNQQKLVSNNIKITGPFDYNLSNKKKYQKEKEYRIILQKLYDFLINEMNVNYKNLNFLVWKTFFPYVKNDKSLEKYKTDKVDIRMKYIHNGEFEYYHNQDENYILVIRMEDLKIIKVDELSALIFKNYKKKRKLSNKIAKKYSEEDIFKRLEKLVQVGFLTEEKMKLGR